MKGLGPFKKLRFLVSLVATMFLAAAAYAQDRVVTDEETTRSETVTEEKVDSKMTDDEAKEMVKGTAPAKVEEKVPTAAVSSEVVTALQKLQTINDAEVKMGKLAATKSKSPAVKDYALTLVTDHQLASDQLSDLAKREGVSLTDDSEATKDLRSQLDKTYESLQAAKEANFDHQFAQEMVKGHKEAITIAETGIEKTRDQDVKDYLTNLNRTLNVHLTKAESLMQQVMAH